MAPKLHSSGRESLSQQRGGNKAKLQWKGNMIRFGPGAKREVAVGEEKKEKDLSRLQTTSATRCEISEFQGCSRSRWMHKPWSHLGIKTLC